jgi:SAM-dependent methyltransferase
MPISVAEYLIEELTTAGAVVLDPMAGSGTTLIAARRLKRTALGFDRDPLAVLITRSALAPLKSKSLERLGCRVLDTAKRHVSRSATGLSRLRSAKTAEDRAFLDYWFPATGQEQLSALARAIQSEASGAEKNFAWVVFSSLIIAKSAGASFALDLPRSRPHKRRDKPVVLPFEAWSRRFRAAVHRLPFRDAKALPSAHISLGDARNIPVDDRSVDFVLTSPPYLDAIDYLRSHKFSLLWMGHGLSELRELRGTMIGSERGLWSLDGLPPNVEHRLERQLETDREVALRRRYLSDLAKVLSEIGRVLRTGGHAVLALGPNIISKKRTDAADLIAAVAAAAGLSLVASVTRHLRGAHRSLPPPRAMAHANPLSARMRREIIVAFRK